ncbi:MAG: LysR family transcriptional regulator [Halocynthiibacter sp.]
MTALRAFVTVAEANGVTRAASYLHLTQSAVSMQLKRLEESVDAQLFRRSNRTLTLTSEGDKLLAYAKRILALNDEAFSRMTDKAYEGSIVLGVPQDILYPAIPTVLRRFHREFPRMEVDLVSSYTFDLRDRFAKGKCDVIITTEDTLDCGGETLVEVPLVWVGARGGKAWTRQPLPFAHEQQSIFRHGVQKLLDQNGIDWEMVVQSHNWRAVEAVVSADLGVSTILEGTERPDFEQIDHGGALPTLMRKQINMYVAEHAKSDVLDRLALFLREAFREF